MGTSEARLHVHMSHPGQVQVKEEITIVGPAIA